MRARSRATACARSTRRTSMRGWKAWFENGSITPARATDMIQDDAQFVRTSVISTASRCLACSSGARRTPMSAARSPRVICGACSMARYSSGRRARADLARARRRSSRSAPPSARALALRTPSRRPSSSPSLSRMSPICTKRVRVGRIERDRLLQMLERRVGIAFLPLDGGQLAIQKRAVRRARHRRRVRRESPRPACPARAASRAAARFCSNARNLSTSTRRRKSVSDGSAAIAASNEATASASRFSASSA